ncbi:MAG TPA: NUDIX hydrolase [Candidatus Baltobacteraceae bacterium]|nr:NUDIX hydrolase [Candidatus Baltobacteraceae bacterium]
MDDTPQVISSHERFEGRVFRVRTDEIEFADGARASVDVVEHRGSYALIATPSPDELVLVRQYRHPVRRELWEIPAGTADPGESVLEGALRELAEETGYRAAAARLLGSLYMTPGFCDEIMHFIHADALTAGRQNLDDDERIAARNFTIEQAWALVRQGEIADAKTLLALTWMRGSRGELAALGADN